MTAIHRKKYTDIYRHTGRTVSVPVLLYNETGSCFFDTDMPANTAACISLRHMAIIDKETIPGREKIAEV